MRFAVPMAVLMSAVFMSLWAASASGQLYRWVDPETGSVKFSSYPPPWFNNPARPPRAPKVEVIEPARNAPAFAPGQEADRDPAAPPAGDAPRGDRQGLLKLSAQRAAALVSSPLEIMGKAHGELVESLQRLEKLERQVKPADPKDEAVRLEERLQLAAPLEVRRAVLLQQVALASPPPADSPPDRVQSAWGNTQRLLGALGWIDSAILIIDPRKANTRHFEMNALIDGLVAQWEPFVDPAIVRKARGR